MPRVSVLIPARNAASTIGPAVRSTLRDLPHDAEVVLFDDASSDGTADLALSLGDGRVRVITSSINVGVAAGLTRLLAETDSELILRMDADDIALRGRYRRQLRALDRGADLVFSTFLRFGTGRPAKPPLPITYGPDASRFLLLLECPAHSTLLARRDTLVNIGGYRGAVTEDYDLWLRAVARGSRMVRLGLPGIRLRTSPGQVTAQHGWHDKLAADPLIATSYGQLVGSIWGSTDAPWLRDLSMLRNNPLTPDGRTRLDAFVHRFTAELRGLPALQQRALARRARQELARRAS